MASNQGNRQTATVIHLALLLGPLLFIAVVMWIRLHPGAPVVVPEPDPRVLRLVAYVTAATSFGAALLLRSRILPLDEGAPEAPWWAVNQGKMIVIWALLEGPMLLAGVVFLLQAHFPTLAAIAGVGLFLMLLTAPGRLAGR